MTLSTAPLHYHMLVQFNKKGKVNFFYHLNLSKQFVMEKYALPYNEKKPIWGFGEPVTFYEITGIHIYENKIGLRINDKMLNGKEFKESTFKDIVASLSANHFNCTDITADFLVPIVLETDRESSTKSKIEKSKIFIVHGRDETSALLLQKHLERNGIEAELF